MKRWLPLLFLMLLGTSPLFARGASQSLAQPGFSDEGNARAIYTVTVNSNTSVAVTPILPTVNTSPKTQFDSERRLTFTSSSTYQLYIATFPFGTSDQNYWPILGSSSTYTDLTHGATIYGMFAAGASTGTVKVLRQYQDPR